MKNRGKKNGTARERSSNFSCTQAVSLATFLTGPYYPGQTEPRCSSPVALIGARPR